MPRGHPRHAARAPTTRVQRIIQIYETCSTFLASVEPHGEISSLRGKLGTVQIHDAAKGMDDQPLPGVCAFRSYLIRSTSPRVTCCLRRS
jgi:hypothetical protein